jgi:membrane-associated phospholipid phosphatase
MFSRIGFSQKPGSERLSVWHLKTSAATGNKPPKTRYTRLINVSRPSMEVFKAQLDYLHQYAALRPDRAGEILVQINAAMDFFVPLVGLRADRTKWTMELMEAAQRLAFFVEMRIKNGLACRRPVELSPQVQPMIQTPAHGSLPSGHSTEAFTVAIVLIRLMKAAAARSGGGVLAPMPLLGNQIMRQAARIAINRTVAGVHFPVDSITGAVLGVTLGSYLADRCEGKPSYRSWRFDGTSFPVSGATDFDWQAHYDVATDTFKPASYTKQPVVRPFGRDVHSPLLATFWEKALEEWT